MSDLVGNPEDRFSRVAAQVIRLAGQHDLFSTLSYTRVLEYNIMFRIIVVVACGFVKLLLFAKVIVNESLKSATIVQLCLRFFSIAYFHWENMSVTWIPHHTYPTFIQQNWGMQG